MFDEAAEPAPEGDGGAVARVGFVRPVGVLITFDRPVWLQAMTGQDGGDGPGTEHGRQGGDDVGGGFDGGQPAGFDVEVGGQCA